MEIEILKEDKNDIELKIDNLTVAEVLRVYLNKQGIEFAAWRREHPTKKPLLIVKTKGKTAKKAVDDAITSIEKDLDKVEADFKKMK